MVKELEQTAFKQTEVGEIPEDWEVESIEKFIRLISGQHILNQDYNQAQEGIPYLTGPADFGSIFPFISKWTNRPKAVAIKGDILITVKGDGGWCSPTVGQLAGQFKMILADLEIVFFFPFIPSMYHWAGVW